jgi:hypothetical protein
VGLSTLAHPELLKWMIAPRPVALEGAAAALLGSIGILTFGLGREWPLGLIALASLAPWAPIFYGEVLWTYRSYGWLALFYVLAVTQGGHALEHVVQVTQIHVLGMRPVDARGVISTLDIEWVHFVWNTWVIVAVVVLARRFPANHWIKLTAVLAGWHEIEHLYIMSQFLTTGVAGTPGLLSKGGVLLGGLPLIRPDLHFWYNLVETVPLMLAFLCQVAGTCEAPMRRRLERVRNVP